MVFETNIICFGHMKHMKKKPNSQDECGVGERGGIIVCGLLPPPRTPSTAAGGPPPSKREVLGFRRSKPAALPSIGYRGFAVAPMTLRASSRNIVVITVTGAAIYETGAQCAPLRGTAMQPSVANASNRCNDAAQRCKRISSLRFPPRCRGAHRAPVDIIQTFDFSTPKTSLFEGGGPPRRRWKEFAPVRNPAGRDFSLGGVSFMPLGISPADEHRRPRRTASLRWRSRPARRRRLHR